MGKLTDIVQTSHQSQGACYLVYTFHYLHSQKQRPRHVRNVLNVPDVLQRPPSVLQDPRQHMDYVVVVNKQDTRASCLLLRGTLEQVVCYSGALRLTTSGGSQTSDYLWANYDKLMLW